MKKKNHLPLAIFLLCGLLLRSAILQAQYDIRISNPTYRSSENSRLSLEAVRFTPGRIILDLAYKADNKSNGYRLGRQTQVAFRGFTNGKSNVKEVKGVEHDNFTTIKPGRTGRFSASFPFSFFHLMTEQGGLSDEAIERFTLSSPFVADLVECTDSYKQLNDVTGCFNISGIQLDVKEEDLGLMLCYDFLDTYLKKDEFETTAQYQRRINPDSVHKKLAGIIESVELLMSMNYTVKMMQEHPQLTYNADQETFTIQYPGARPARIKVPASQAAAFKQDVQLDRYSLDNLITSTDKNGTFVIRALTLIRDKKEISFNNLDWPGHIDLFREKKDRVLAMLKKTYPKKAGVNF